MEARVNKVLFICTGNYYRSRFAEYFFNHWAGLRKMDWVAESRGLRSDNPNNAGPISPFALAGLKQRGIAVPEALEGPKPLELDDLESATDIIALKEEEHRPLMEALFPDWVEEVDYWQINDIDVEAPDSALQHLDEVIYDYMDMLSMRSWKPKD